MKASMRKILTSICIILSFYCKGQTGDSIVRGEILSIAEKIARDGMIVDTLFLRNLNALKPYLSQWERFIELREKATDNELIVLTNHLNEIVRCYAFRALVMNNNVNCFEILKNHLIDYKQIRIHWCDYSKHKHISCFPSVGDYFIFCVSTPISENSYLLNNQQKKELDSIVLYNDSIYLSYRSCLLQRLKPDLAHYERVREIVLKYDGELVALATLARYQNPNDIPIFKDFFKPYRRFSDGMYFLLLAIREYPDSAFYKDLVKTLKRNRGNWRLLYQTLAQYPTDETVKLFEKIAKEKKLNTKKADLMIAITKYPHEKYEHLKNKLKIDDKILAELWEEEKKATEWENGE